MMGAAPSVIHRLAPRPPYRWAATPASSSFLINGVFRGSGDAATAMRTLWLANLINIVLDPCFIYGYAGFPKLGVTGAAVATTTGRSIGVLYQLWVLFGGRGRAVTRRHLRLDWPVLRRLHGRPHLDLPVLLRGDGELGEPVADQCYLRRRGHRGLHARRAHHHVRHHAFVGIGSAAATLVGQNLGARRPDRSARCGWRATTTWRS